jgi:glycosyltransferase involved in cell wall biosynthesis
MGAGMTVSQVSAVDVSVVIPVFNRFDVLTEAVASVLAQTRLPKEILIVDDGSTDDGADMSFSHPDVSIRQIRLRTNSGAPVARNTGVLAAQGEWIAFLDADDLWEPEKLARQIGYIEGCGGQVDAVATNIFRRRPGQPDVVVNPRRPRFDAELSLDLMVNYIALQTSALMIKREVLLLHPFDVELTKCQDWDLVLRLTSAGFRWGYLDEPLSFYRVGYDSRRITVSRSSAAGSKIWLKKQMALVDPRAAAYYFSRHCLATALRSNDFSGVAFWLYLSTRSGPSLLYAAAGLAAKFRQVAWKMIGAEH